VYLHHYAQAAQTLKQPLSYACSVALVEICLAEILVSTAVTQKVVRDNQNGVCNGNSGSLRAASGG
jgi:hypothetical protein